MTFDERAEKMVQAILVGLPDSYFQYFLRQIREAVLEEKSKCSLAHQEIEVIRTEAFEAGKEYGKRFLAESVEREHQEEVRKAVEEGRNEIRSACSQHQHEQYADGFNAKIRFLEDNTKSVVSLMNRNAELEQEIVKCKAEAFAEGKRVAYEDAAKIAEVYGHETMCDVQPVADRIRSRAKEINNTDGNSGE